MDTHLVNLLVTLKIFFSEEVRIASNLDGRLQFLLGFYYEDKETEFVRVNLFGGVDPALNGGSIFISSNNTKRELEQKAIFGELAHDVTDDIKFTFGTRSFDIMETFRDRRPVEVRSDVLTYTTAPFTEPLTILGDIELAVFGIRVLMG